VWTYAATEGATVLANSAPDILCEEVCTESTACEETCYENMMEFENGNDLTCLEWGTYDESVACCGDGICNKDSDDNESALCYVDCGSIGPICTDCNPYNQTGCSGDDACANDGCCVPSSGPPAPSPPPACFQVFCFKDSDCCQDDVCIKVDAWPGSPSGVCYTRL
jgi:hypothetical protein